MPLFDKPLEELVAYNPDLTRESNFDQFWNDTLSESRQTKVEAELHPTDYPAIGVQVFEVFFTGFRGVRISAWYLVPEGPGPFPALIQYHGYSGSKGEVYSYLMWALQGYAVLAVDVRGQSGKTPDPAAYSEGHITGWMTMGIQDPYEYYYRAVYMDCVRAIDFLCSQPEVDASRIGVMGISQGGGLTLAVAALDTRPVLAMPEVPYLCHYKRATDMAVRMPYLEIINYIRRWPGRAEQVWKTLSYFDNLNLAPRIRCPVLMDVGLQDDICPPSTIYAVYNHIKTSKAMKIYPYHNHEVVETHWEDKLRWAHYYLKGVGPMPSTS